MTTIQHARQAGCELFVSASKQWMTEADIVAGRWASV
jgi:hypothetical protein